MNIIIERGKVINFKDLPEYSIALDGFCQGPQVDAENHKYSFDHHAGCIRFATSSACMQAWTSVMLGLNPDNYTIYCNDVDSDVCAAIWCLKNPQRCKEPQVAKLIDAIGKGDMHGGAFDVNGMKKIVDWICAPQTESIKNGDYEKLSDEGLKPILESILHRIDLYSNGEHSIEVSKHIQNNDFKIIRSENGWALFESNDPHVLANIWQAGFDRIVITRPLPDKSTAVTIAKRSDFIDGFSLPKIFKALNKLETGWGGGSTIGGAPRNPDGSRSKLPVDKIVNTIDVALGFVEPPSKERKSKAPAAKKKVESKK